MDYNTLKKPALWFALSSVVLGAWAFKTVNEISGPEFEPILAACTNTSIASLEDFVEQTGYHVYEPKVGLGVFNFLVCLITQFLLELRQTPPDGLLVWGGIITVAMTYSVMATIEAGRNYAKGPIRYPMIIGLFGQLFGISVVVPLLWVPSYIYGRGRGPVPILRSYCSVILALPGILLTAIVFAADPNGYLWTISAGILGGPLLVISGALYWPITPIAIKESSSSSSSSSSASSLQLLEKCSKATQNVYHLSAAIAFGGYMFLVSVAYSKYGTNLFDLWDAIWTNANASVAFMTVDMIVLYVSILSYIAYQSVSKVFKAVLLTPFVGPAAASLVLAELEQEQVQYYDALLQHSSSVTKGKEKQI